jgi:hypothetical protein
MAQTRLSLGHHLKLGLFLHLKQMKQHFIIHTDTYTQPQLLNIMVQCSAILSHSSGGQHFKCLSGNGMS